MFMHILISVFTTFKYACDLISVISVDRIQNSYRRVVQEICRLFDVGSDAFLVQLRIHANLDLRGETVIFRAVLKLALTLIVWAVYMVIRICIHTMNQCDTNLCIRKRGGERGQFLLRGGNRNFNLQLLQNLAMS